MKRFMVATLVALASAWTARAETITGTVTIDGKNDVKGFKLQEAVIYIQSKDAPAVDDPKGPRQVGAIIDQKDKTYVPHVVAIPAGSAVEFHNSDPELHNQIGRAHV